MVQNTWADNVGFMISLESIYKVAKGSRYQSNYNFKEGKMQNGKDFVSKQQNCDAEGATEKGFKNKQSLDCLGSHLRRVC